MTSADATIILIGPSKTGKTTLAKLLTERLNLPLAELDDLRWNYYAEIGYDPTFAQQLRREKGFAALAAYWKPFDIHGVERVVAEHAGSVISFGAGHSYYDDDILFARAKQALAPVKNIVLVLPSPDIEESMQILTDRLRMEMPDIKGDILDLNELFLRHHSNDDLATMTVYTKGQSPEETREAIIANLRSG
jgi:hypothetical protein